MEGSLSMFFSIALGFLILLVAVAQVFTQDRSPEYTDQSGWSEGEDELEFEKDEAIEWIEDKNTAHSIEATFFGDPEARRQLSREELIELVIRLRIEIGEAQAIAESLSGVAVARVQGRVHTWKGKWMHLAVVDSPEPFQRVVLQVPDEEDQETLQVGLAVDLACKLKGGRIVLDRILSAEECSAPIPELPEMKKAGVPDWFDSNSKNQKRDLLKASEGSSSVSDLKVHIVWATKRRKKILTAPIVERMKILAEEVVQERGLGKLLALNAEAEHCHLAIFLPNTVSASQAAGVLKSRLAKALREEFPELVAVNTESLWQRGFYAGSIGNGGDLSTVLKYIEGQQGAPEGEVDEEDGECIEDGERGLKGGRERE